MHTKNPAEYYKYPVLWKLWCSNIVKTFRISRMNSTTKHYMQVCLLLRSAAVGAATAAAAGAAFARRCAKVALKTCISGYASSPNYPQLSSHYRFRYNR